MTTQHGPTHDWASAVDLAHLDDIRRRAAELAPGGALHLLLEVLAYPAEEAADRGGGRCRVTLHADGSVEVADDGRGTQTRVAAAGRAVRKPVMSTRDLRFFDAPDAPLLPDGHRRRGMSVVAALSTWLVHRNRRLEGAWVQRYEQGVPVGDLDPVERDGTTGTTVHFLPAPGLDGLPHDAAERVRTLAAGPMTVEVADDRRPTLTTRASPHRP